MDDLSQPDALFRFPIYLPVLGNEFNLLPILVVVVMLWNQKFQPKPATEQARQQQKMMKFMPVLFGFLFYQMPSGLCVYFVTSMGIGSLERWLIDKRAGKVDLRPADEEARAKKRRVPAGKEPAKSGWLQKLAKMQKKLQEQPRPPRKTKRGKNKK
jgi:YidC/Oxa1 family membrane protein insertase